MNINSVSFKACIPVKHYAKHPETGTYRRLTDDKQVRKCQGKVIRNLNGNLTKTAYQPIVDFYKQADADYSKTPEAVSIYRTSRTGRPEVYMVTGDDTEIIKEYGRKLGIAISGFDSEEENVVEKAEKTAKEAYFDKAFHFIKYHCKRVKSSDGKNLSLKVYFIPKYNKKGEIKDFQICNAKLEREE